MKDDDKDDIPVTSSCVLSICQIFLELFGLVK